MTLTQQEIEALEDEAMTRYDREDNVRRIRTAQIKAERRLVDRLDRAGAKRKGER